MVSKNSAAAKNGESPVEGLSKIFEGFPNLEEVEWRYAQTVLEAVDGNQTRAAEILGINRKTLYRLTHRKNFSS